MASDTQHYPALYVIFTLLNAIRRGIVRKDIWREFRRQKIALKPRLSFWVSVCKQAGLLSRSETLVVTRYARTWLNKSPEEQTIDLLEAWQSAPKNIGARRFRRKLLWKLKYGRMLTQKDSSALRGLEALGLCDHEKLTAWGKLFIKEEGSLPTPRPPEPCHLHENHFIAPLAQHIDLLWEIENHLRASTPARYPLTKRAICYLQGDPHDLICLLERGLQDSLPDSIKARLLDQPSVHMAEGIVLEFSHPADLQALRRQPNLRQHIEQFLSPRSRELFD